MYHNSKGLYKKAKEEEERRKAIEGTVELGKVKDSVALARLNRIQARLADPDGGLTIEELQGLVGMEKHVDEDDRPLTRKDLEAIERSKQEEQNKVAENQQRIQRKILEAEAYAKANISDLTDGAYQTVDEVVALAQEIAAKKPRYLALINQAFNSDDMSEAEAVDVIIDIARLNKNWGTSKKNGEKVNPEADRAIKNADKQKTSASLVGSKGSRVVTYDELTPEDAAKLSADQWSKLPKNVRDRILNQL
jgi:hypothetical protein